MVPILGIKFSPADKVTGIYMFMSMSWTYRKTKLPGFYNNQSLQRNLATIQYNAIQYTVD